MNTSNKPNNHTLDPENWDDIRAQGHKIFDSMIDHLEGIHEVPSWQPMTEDAIAALKTPMPEGAGDLAAVYQSFQKNIAPFVTGNHTARHWGWVNGCGTPEGVIAGMMANTYTPNCILHRSSSLWVEMQVLDWFKDVCGFPKGAGGVLTSGGSLANFNAMAAARFAGLGEQVRKTGIPAGKKGYRVYSSKETHYSIAKAWDLLGMGLENSVAIPLDADYRMDMQALKAQVAKDRTAGYVPLAIVGSLITVGVGAIDPLGEMADFAAAEGLWFHVDAAIGFALFFSEKHKPLTRGAERADSIAFDLHKWLSQPYSVGAVLCRHGKNLEDTFHVPAPYINATEGTLADPPIRFSDYTLEMSRGFRALPVWMSMQVHGRKTFGDMVDAGMAQMKMLEGLIVAAPELELLTPAYNNVLNFRYVTDDLSNPQLDALNSEIYTRLNRAGIASPSTFVVDGKFCIRVCNTNHRSRDEDFRDMVDAVIRIGADVLAGRA